MRSVSKNPPGDRERAWLVVLLAWAAGYVDAIGFLTLFHLFTAHMSGNTAAFGAYLGSGQWHLAFHRFFPIPIYMVGILIGAASTEAAISARKRSVFWLPLAAEIALLLSFMAFGAPLVLHGAVRAGTSWKFYSLVALPSLAMGIQSATVRRVGHTAVRTTFVTGMLTDCVEHLVAFLFMLAERRRPTAARHGIVSDADSLAKAGLFGGIWLAFAAGATIGGLADLHGALFTLVFPTAGLAVVMVYDLYRPLYTAPS